MCPIFNGCGDTDFKPLYLQATYRTMKQP